MRSSELARLAEVSVRTLRHYHQVGVLPEPYRLSNGYREYDVHDLMRVLRIKRLAALGIPLDQIRDVDGVEASGDQEKSDEMLAQLDAELAAQMKRLQTQRDAIALLRSHRAAPDVPIELAPFFALGVDVGISPEMAKMDREYTALLTHLAGDQAQKVIDLFTRLDTPEMRAATADFGRRFADLGEASTELDIQALITDYRKALFATVSPDEIDGIDLSEHAQMLDAYQSQMLNPQQRRVIEELGKGWE